MPPKEVAGEVVGKPGTIQQKLDEVAKNGGKEAKEKFETELKTLYGKNYSPSKEFLFNFGFVKVDGKDILAFYAQDNVRLQAENPMQGSIIQVVEGNGNHDTESWKASYGG